MIIIYLQLREIITSQQLNQNEEELDNLLLSFGQIMEAFKPPMMTSCSITREGSKAATTGEPM